MYAENYDSIMLGMGEWKMREEYVPWPYEPTTPLASPLHTLYTRTYLWSKVESKPICCQEVFRRWWTLRFSKAEEQQRTNEHVASDVQLFVSCPLHGVLQIDFKHEILIIRTCASASQSVNRLLASPSPCWTGRLIWK